MKTSYTTSKIETATNLVKQFAPKLSDNELFVLDLALKDIAKAAVSEYMKAMIDNSYELDAAINDFKMPSL